MNIINICKSVYQGHMIHMIVIPLKTIGKKILKSFRQIYPQIKEDTAKYINVAFDKEDTDKNGNYMLRGFIGDSLKKWNSEKEKLNLNYAPYGFYYSGFGFNDEEMLIYTWCEGDTTLTLFNDRETYQKEREEIEKWFDENCQKGRYLF